MITDILLTEGEIDRVFETGGTDSDYWNAVAITAQRKLWGWLISACPDKSHYGHDDPMLRLERIKCPDCKADLVKMMVEL